MYKVHAKKPNGKNVSLRYDSPPEDVRRLIEFMDKEIIKPRLDRKGLIATMSYKYQQEIMSHSQYSNIMLGNTQDPASDSAQEVAEEFRRAKPPALLASPSFTTGWDFPMDQCEYIIVFKTPWVPAFSKIAKARLAKDPRYADALGMKMLEQICGRGMRRMNDRCEVFMIDGSIGGFLFNNRTLAQDWFYDAVRGVPTVPKPPMRLVDEWKLGKAG
jgi:Rad3-related DNA helicase